MITSLLFHGTEPMDGPVAESGSSLFDLMPKHIPALWAMGLSLVAGLVLLQLRRWSLVAGFRQLPLRQRWIAILIIISGAAHAGLVIGSTRGWKILFGGSALLAILCVYRMIRGQSWRLLAWILLAGSLVGYWIELLRGHPTDQIGLAVKVIEVLGIYLLLLPKGVKAAFKRFASTAALIVLALFNTAAVWAGAFQGANGDANPVDHQGMAPGMVMNVDGPSDTSVAQRLEANLLWAETSAFTARYRDVALAAADGYQVEGIAGSDFHAANPTYRSDGLMLDPSRPENLIYAMGPRGPILMGVMFETEGLADDPPELGGAALHWHRHEQVCMSLTPPGIAGLVDPFGHCPVGSLVIPTTNSMMHVWTVANAPTRFGDLDEEWKKEYLASLPAR